MAPPASTFEPSSFIPFPSRRSTVYSTSGIVACTQPLAARAGQRVLEKGGNAADAAVAVAAALNVTEPCNTGIGGDCFALFYDAKTKTVKGLNGSGRSAKGLSVEELRKKVGAGPDGKDADIPLRSPLAVTVPGAAAGWVDVVDRWGSGNVTRSEVLQPAIDLAEQGFPVTEVAAGLWSMGEDLLRKASPNGAEMLKKDSAAPHGVRAPHVGELFRNPTLAQTFRQVGINGRKGFYEGHVANETVRVLQSLGSAITLEDLREHGERGSQDVAPISATFTGQGTESDGGVTLWECPPNGQGIVALMALGILEALEESGRIPQFKPADHNSPEYIHAIVEALRIAFADASWWVADPDVSFVPIDGLLSRNYLTERAKLFDPQRASPPLEHGSPAMRSSDTVYFAVTDKFGNGCSFINSNYAGFGTAIVPQGCGFTLQNRGANFTLRKEHPNVYAPGKRPYHTIIPGLVTNTRDQSLHAVMGVMGGFMQPQGHVQVLMNLRVFGMSPQTALDAPRVCIGAGLPDAGDVGDRTVFLEEGISQATVQGLEKLGHVVQVFHGLERFTFGRGQVIRCVQQEGNYVYSAGSDLRGDGAAFPA